MSEVDDSKGVLLLREESAEGVNIHAMLSQQR